MPSMTESLTQALLVADQIAPANYAANTYTSTGIDLQDAGRALFLIQVGVITGAATIDANLQSAAASNFATPHNITNSNITQITSTNNANTVVTIEVRADQVMAQNAGDRYVRLRIVSGTNAAFMGAIGIAAPLWNKPALTNTGLNTAVLIQQQVTASPSA